LLYVGYGGKDAGKDYGEIGLIDAKTDKHIGDIQVTAHPSEILLNKSGETLFVFVSIASQVQVVDTKNRKAIAIWPVSSQRNGDGAFDFSRSLPCHFWPLPVFRCAACWVLWLLHSLPHYWLSVSHSCSCYTPNVWVPSRDTDVDFASFRPRRSCGKTIHAKVREPLESSFAAIAMVFR
jgi:hypothetical protein